MKKNPKTKPEADREHVPTVAAKCILGHKWNMTRREVNDAQEFGCAMCPKCGNVATVERIGGNP